MALWGIPLELWIFGTWLAICFVLGLVSQPLFIFLIGPSAPLLLRRIWGKILFTAGQLMGEGVVLDKRAGAPYRLAPAKASYSEGSEILIDGEWLELEGPPRWTLLGRRPFGITYEKAKGAFRTAAVEPGDTERIDERGSKSEWIPSSSEVGSGSVVSSAKAVSRLRKAGRPNLIKTAQQKALELHGGNSLQLTNMQLLGASLGALVIGVGTGMVML